MLLSPQAPSVQSGALQSAGPGSGTGLGGTGTGCSFGGAPAAASGVCSPGGQENGPHGNS